MAKYSILAFDPGLTKAGWSLINYDDNTDMCTVSKFGTLQAKKIVARKEYREECAKYDGRIVALSVLRELVQELFMKLKPDYVVIEDAFYNPSRPSAFAALTQWILTVELMAYKDFQLQTFKVSPRAAKHTICGDGSGQKSNIQKAVLTHEKIRFSQKNQTVNMCSHEADSVSVGYHFVANILPGLRAMEIAS